MLFTQLEVWPLWGQVPRTADVQQGNSELAASRGVPSSSGRAAVRPAAFASARGDYTALLLARHVGKALSKALNSTVSISDLRKLGEGSTPSCTNLNCIIFNIQVLLLKIYFQQ